MHHPRKQQKSATTAFKPISAAQALGQDLNAIDLCVINDRCELNGDPPIAVRWRGERLHDCLVRTSRGSDDVEIAQDLLPINGDIENSLSAAAPIEFRKVQAHRIGMSNYQPGIV